MLLMLSVSCIKPSTGFSGPLSFSNNISDTLDSLLAVSVYDRRLRPDHGGKFSFRQFFCLFFLRSNIELSTNSRVNILNLSLNIKVVI